LPSYLPPVFCRRRHSGDCTHALVKPSATHINMISAQHMRTPRKPEMTTVFIWSVSKLLFVSEMSFFGQTRCGWPRRCDLRVNEYTASGPVSRPSGTRREAPRSIVDPRTEIPSTKECLRRGVSRTPLPRSLSAAGFVSHSRRQLLANAASRRAWRNKLSLRPTPESQTPGASPWLRSC